MFTMLSTEEKEVIACALAIKGLSPDDAAVRNLIFSLCKYGVPFLQILDTINHLEFE